MPVSLEVAYQQYFPIVERKCARILSADTDATDIAQETFVRLWESGVMQRDPRAVTAWIFKTATRLAIDRLRRTNREPPPGAHPESDKVGAEHDVRQWVSEALQVLSEEELEAALLARVDELSQAEVAEVLHVSVRTVRRYITAFDAYVESRKRGPQ